MKYWQHFLISILFLYCSHKGDGLPLGFLTTDQNDSMRHYFSYPGKYENIEKKQNVINRILSLIQAAKEEILIYAYSLNNPQVIEALYSAQNRGIKLRFILDKDKDYSGLKEKKFRLEYWNGSGLQHVKVMLFDKKILFTGTGNFSEFGLTQDYNGYMEVQFPRDLGLSFSKFLLSEDNRPVFIYKNQIGETLTFINSPQNGRQIQNTILREIDSARVSIQYLIFDHYDPLITHALKKAVDRGLLVEGIYNTPVDPEGLDLSGKFCCKIGGGVFEDGNEDSTETGSIPEGGLLHHKTMIIDKKKVLSGSYNYSQSARDSNRELFYIIESPSSVHAYVEEWDRVRNMARPVTGVVFQPGLHENTNIRSQEAGQNCMPDAESPLIMEVGAGLFQSTLLLTEKQEADCFSISAMDSYSAGILATDKKLSSNSFAQFGNINLYSYINGIRSINRDETKCCGSVKMPDIKNANYMDLTSTGILFSIEGIDPNKKAYWIRAGKSIVASDRLQVIQNGLYKISFDLDPASEAAGAIWFSGNPGSMVLYTRFGKENRFLSEMQNEWCVRKSLDEKNSFDLPGVYILY